MRERTKGYAVSELSPDAAALVRSCRRVIQPSPLEQDRIAAALRFRLGEAALPLETAIPEAVVYRTAWAKLSAAAVAIGLAGGLTLFALQKSASLSRPAPQRVFDLTPAQAAPAMLNVDSSSPTQAEAPSSAPAEPVPVSSPSSRPPTDRLAEEVAIMSRAASDLHTGRPASALQAIAEHQRKFPSGVLAEERRSARIQALCALGRRDEASAELERLERVAPKSPTTLRALQVCGVTGRSR